MADVMGPTNLVHIYPLGSTEESLRGRVGANDFWLAIAGRRNDIIYHYSAQGDDRCHEDDYLVHRWLDDTPNETGLLPPPEERKRLCAEFYEWRRNPRHTKSGCPLKVPDDVNCDVREAMGRYNYGWLYAELLKIQVAIKKHRDNPAQENRPRTYKDDLALYAAVPGLDEPNFWLPSREEFLNGWGESGGCPHFWRSHQKCPVKIHNFHAWGPCGKEQ